MTGYIQSRRPVTLSSYGERCGGETIAMVDFLKSPKIHVLKLLEF